MLNQVSFSTMDRLVPSCILSCVLLLNYFTSARELSVSDWSVRLRGVATDTSRGIIQIAWEGAWHDVCGKAMYMEEADVCCRQLGFSKAASAQRIYTNQNQTTIMMIRPKCYGSERAITDCASGDWPPDEAGSCDEVMLVICDSVDERLGIPHTGLSTGGAIVIASLSALNLITAIVIIVFIVRRLREKSALASDAVATSRLVSASCDLGGSELSSVGACGEQDVPRRYFHGENVYETAMNLLRAHHSAASHAPAGDERPVRAARAPISRQTSKV